MKYAVKEDTSIVDIISGKKIANSCTQTDAYEIAETLNRHEMLCKIGRLLSDLAVYRMDPNFRYHFPDVAGLLQELHETLKKG